MYVKQKSDTVYQKPFCSSSRKVHSPSPWISYQKENAPLQLRPCHHQQCLITQLGFLLKSFHKKCTNLMSLLRLEVEHWLEEGWWRQGLVSESALALGVHNSDTALRLGGFLFLDLLQQVLHLVLHDWLSSAGPLTEQLVVRLSLLLVLH